MRSAIIINLWLGIIFLSFSFRVSAQQDAQSSLYMFNPLAYNPAYAGSRGTIHFVLHHRSQWVGIQGAPHTQFFSFSMPLLKDKLGIGLNFQNDMIGVRLQQAIYADFAYNLKLNRQNHRLSFGISAGADIYQANFNGLIVDDPSDPNLGSGQLSAVPNFGFGLMYHGKRHFVGVSIPRLLPFTMGAPMAIGQQPVISRHYFLMGGYNLSFARVWEFKPSAILQISENAPFTFTLNPSFVWNKKVWMGMLYRFNESFGFNIGYYFLEKVHVVYAFDFPYNDLRYNDYGSHEILIGIDLGKRKRRPSDCFF
ncbi:MAG: type IX secretion system membrane protein PorP/SprF [Candidatus Competibacteraceae bacterium]|nr:type IX secretion system membrane protein PorP/SprF [Candidatus Competibacteraceae bacterium]